MAAASKFNFNSPAFSFGGSASIGSGHLFHIDPNYYTIAGSG